jgi:hypothetical protein
MENTTIKTEEIKMEFLDNAVNIAKEAFDIAYKKTEEVVTTQKQKLDVVSIENKRAKDFTALGEIYFNMIKDSEIDNIQVKELVDAIKEKNQKIADLKNEINTTKNKRICPECGANISDSSKYCNICGAKLVFESEGNE